MPQDILMKTEDAVFSYRVAGILVKDGHVLLQRPTNDPGYAVPGGHVTFGETNAQTLEREFQEEIGAAIRVGDLALVGELFFPWGKRTCHQICLYYWVSLEDKAGIPTSGMFQGIEQLEERAFTMNFYWVPIDQLHEILLYPPEIKEYLQKQIPGVQTFIYRETEDL